MFEGLFQPMHLILILIIALIIFGPGKLPELGRGLGKSIREFKKAMSGEEENAGTGTNKEIAPQTTVEMNKGEVSPGTADTKKEAVSRDTIEKKA